MSPKPKCWQVITNVTSTLGACPCFHQVSLDTDMEGWFQFQSAGVPWFFFEQVVHQSRVEVMVVSEQLLDKEGCDKQFSRVSLLGMTLVTRPGPQVSLPWKVSRKSPRLWFHLGVRASFSLSEVGQNSCFSLKDCSFRGTSGTSGHLGKN